MAKKKKKTVRTASSFEESLGEVERIVVELESGELGLSDALARYEEGVEHLKSCQAQLDRAERKIELLSGVDVEGNPITEPFDDDADESLTKKAAVRGKRRTSFTGKSGRYGLADDVDVDSAGRLF